MAGPPRRWLVRRGGGDVQRGGEQYKWRTAGAGCSDRSYGDLREGTGFYFRTCLGHAADNFISWATCGNTEITTA